MAKINGKNIDPKAYAARVTQAKKIIAKTDPELKRKIAQMYPKVTKEQIANKMLNPKKATPKVATKSPPRPPAKLTPKATTKPKPKVTKLGPIESTRVGGIISVPKKPKKTVY